MYHDILIHIDLTFAPGTAGSTAQVKS
jgi:hypothetical protein